MDTHTQSRSNENPKQPIRPREELLAEFMNHSRPKTEMEHEAVREIELLREAYGDLFAALQVIKLRCDNDTRAHLESAIGRHHNRWIHELGQAA